MLSLRFLLCPYTLKSPTWKEPVLEDSPSSGEPLGSGSGEYTDWGSLRLQADFGPMDDEFAT